MTSPEINNRLLEFKSRIDELNKLGREASDKYVKPFQVEASIVFNEMIDFISGLGKTQ